MSDITFERFSAPDRPRATRVSGRPERMTLHTGGAHELTSLPFVPGNKGPEVQNVSLLPDIVSLGGDFLGTNAEMLGDAAAGTADWASRHRYILGFDIMGLLSFKWGSKLWRMVTRPRDRY